MSITAQKPMSTAKAREPKLSVTYVDEKRSQRGS
jgi:hypothetical protein